MMHTALQKDFPKGLFKGEPAFAWLTGLCMHSLSMLDTILDQVPSST